MMMNRREFSTALLAGAAASMISSRGMAGQRDAAQGACAARKHYTASMTNGVEHDESP
jgi:hypothetical protein